MYKQKSVHIKSIPILAVAPTTKKVGAGSVSKSRTGFIAKSSGGKSSSSPFGTSGKTSNSLGGGKSGTITGKSGSSKCSSGTSNSVMSSTSKSGSFLGSSRTSGSLMGSSGKSSASFLGSVEKSGSFIGGSGKSTSPPLLIGSKRSTAFTTSPSKSNPSTSFVTPKKTSSSFGIIWIPTKRHHKKKEYVHVAHNDNGAKARSPSMYHYDHTPADSPHLPYKKKEEETNLLLLERPKGPIVTAASAGTVVATVEPSHDNTEPTNPDDGEEKQQLNTLCINDKEETKDSPELANCQKHNKDDNDNQSYLENESITNKSPESRWERGDKVDSVYLRPPPPHKVRSNASSREEEEDCGIKCLYYTLQCCDCVLM